MATTDLFRDCHCAPRGVTVVGTVNDGYDVTDEQENAPVKREECPARVSLPRAPKADA